MVSQRNKAFTLVELLVVISIIALLLSILMPSLSKTRESAKRVVCQSNLKQIYTALTLYSAENEFTYPHEFMMTSFGYYNISYQNDFRPLVEKYGAEGKLFYCPSGGSYFADGKTLVKGPNDKFGWNKYSGIGVFSYGIYACEGTLMANVGGRVIDYVTWYDDDGNVSNKYRAIPYEWRELNISNPSSKVMAQDLIMGDMGKQAFNHPRALWISEGISPKGAGFNNVYYDGHVQWRVWSDAILMGEYIVGQSKFYR